MSKPMLAPEDRKLRNKQYIVVGVIAGAVLSLFAYAYVQSLPDPELQARRRASEDKVITHKIEPPGNVDQQDLWRNSAEKDLQEMRNLIDKRDSKLSEYERELEQLKRELQSKESRNLPPLPAPPSRNASTANMTQLPPIPGSPGAQKSQTSASGQPQAAQVSSGIFRLKLDTPETEAKDTLDPHRKTVDNFLPAGSFIQTRLLSGLDAPTGGQAQANPMPFLVVLKDNGQLPNGFRSKVKRCHIILSGYGDISSERVYGRTETLTCVMKDRTILETKIKGYISGEDGKNGMRGRLVSKQGQLIAYSLLSGLAGGVGQGLAESVTSLNTSPLGSTQTVDPDKVFEYGAYKGTGTALDRISKWYLDRADETYPIIEAAAGRTVEIVITEGVYLNEGQIERARRPIITDEERRKAATVESTPWSERASQ